MAKEKWEIVGVVGVDGGEVYITGESPCGGENGDYEKFTTHKTFPTAKGVKQVKYEAGHPGRGVISRTLVGDGTYPVFVRYDKKDKRPIELKINFNPRMDVLQKFEKKLERINKQKPKRIAKLRKEEKRLRKIGDRGLKFPISKEITKEMVRKFREGHAAHKKWSVIAQELEELTGE